MQAMQELKPTSLSREKIFERINYRPTKIQATVHNSKARFRILAWGTRSGKTYSAAAEAVWAAISYDPEQHRGEEGIGWIVAPYYELTDKVFRRVYNYFTLNLPHWVVKKSEHLKEIKLINGFIIKAKSADNPDSLLGEKLAWLILDECSRIKRDTWESYLYPRIVDLKGWVLAISTPKGQNWFFELYTRGKDRLEKAYESFAATTSQNPYIDKAELENARRTLPDRVFRQEFLAEFISDMGGVFRKVKDCMTGQFKNPEGHKKYVIGVDLAKYSDFTVMIVIDVNEDNVVYFDRFNQIDWTFQKQRILSISKRYNDATVFLDSTGVGDPIWEDLNKQTSGNMIGFSIKSNAIKRQLIDGLVIAIENKAISYPEIEELINELTIFEYEKMPSGIEKMHAPAGYHDDCVIALALAVYGLGKVPKKSRYHLA